MANIGADDIIRAATNFDTLMGQGSLNDDWMQLRHFDEDGLTMVMRGGMSLFIHHLEKHHGDVERAVYFTTLDAFKLGFEIALEFGRLTDED